MLVQIKAAGVNPVDTYVRSGNYARMVPMPVAPGDQVRADFGSLGVVELCFGA